LVAEPVITPNSTPEFDPAVIEAGRVLFAGECEFVRGVVAIDQMPDTDLPEIAFAGRSNVGKSSLINALTNRKTLARTSNTPGRTREINFFNLAGRLMLADLPGYGYARVPKAQVEVWTRLVNTYLRGRPSLRRACVLIDARHGIKESDITVMKMLDAAAVSYQIVLTKADKVKLADLANCLERTKTLLRTHIAAHPEIHVTSSEKGDGIAELRAALGEIAAPKTG
jgi:GTP-binding protein